MSQLDKVQSPRLESLRVRVAPPATVVFSGTITSKDPAAEVGPFLRAVHEAALADKLDELKVDVSALSLRQRVGHPLVRRLGGLDQRLQNRTLQAPFRHQPAPHLAEDQPHGAQVLG